MVFPDSTGVPPANEDMPDEIKHDYYEAASIVQKSPRGAAALVRLALQKLFIHIGQKGKNNNDDIASMVAAGLSRKLQQALDYLRVVGNESVHPGTLDLKDDYETAVQLFGVINIVVDELISREKHIDALYNQLPPEKRKAIEDRDKPKAK
jgi:hypothetical protein